MVSFDSKSYSKKLLHLISWSHWFTFFNIIAAIALSSFYLFSEASPETFLGQVYLITTWVSHIGFLTFMSFVLILFPLTLVLPHTKFIRTCGSIIFTVGLLLLVLDGFIYSRLGYHLNASSSPQIISLIKEQIKYDRRTFWLVSTVLTIVVIIFQLTISNFAWKHLKQLQKTIFARFVIFALVLSFFFSHLVHVWADANLNYDILRQDTVLPLSYPTTAKALLTKYGLFNRDDYTERKNSPLAFTEAIPEYPHLMGQCNAKNVSQSVFMVVTDDVLTQQQIKQFKRRVTNTNIQFDRHIDNATSEKAWFNLLYSLPSIYQQDILLQQTKPLLFQALDEQKRSSSFTLISNYASSNTSSNASGKVSGNQSRDLSSNTDNEIEPLWFESLFQHSKTLPNISSLVFADKLNSMPAGLHVIYFEKNSVYQYELFVDALLLAQKQKKNADIIWISSIGNQSEDTRLSIKPSLLVWPNIKSEKLDKLTSTMDLQPTLMKNWLGCNMDKRLYGNGSDLLTLDEERIIANTTKDGIMVFNKDKSVFIDQNGNFQSYSSQLDAPITVTPDFPLMIDGVQLIKQFSRNNQQ